MTYGLKGVLGLALAVAAFVGAIVVFSNTTVLAQARPYVMTIQTAPTGTQAIIVLGAYVRPDGQLSPALRERLDTGLKLYQNKIAPKILVTGDHGTKQYNEVQAMKEYLTGKGVSEADIFMDHAGFDTYDSLYRARDVFGIKCAVAVSQDFHVPRAVYIGRSLGMEIYGVDTGYHYPWWFAMVMREWLARVKAVLNVQVLHSKPKFLGPAIDIAGDGRVTQD